MNEEHIQARVELWRENGSWRMMLRAPRWLISDLAEDLYPSDVGLTLANYGGPSDAGEHTLLLVPYRFGGPGIASIGSPLSEAAKEQQTHD